MVVSTGDRINVFIRRCTAVMPGQKQNDRNNEVTSLTIFFIRKCMAVLPGQKKKLAVITR